MRLQAWDMAAEMCLLQLPALLSGEPGADFQPSPFFAEQLTAFELWLAHGSVGKQPPEQLPIVLQVPWYIEAESCCAGEFVLTIMTRNDDDLAPWDLPRGAFFLRMRTARPSI